MVRHKLRTEFGLSAQEADEELNDRASEVFIHLKIWELISKREKREMEKANRRNKRG